MFSKILCEGDGLQQISDNIGEMIEYRDLEMRLLEIP